MAGASPEALRLSGDAEARVRSDETAVLGMSRTALMAAVALHAACLAATVSFVHSVPPPASAAVELVVQMEALPAAVALPTEAAATPEPETAALPEAVAAASAEPPAALPEPALPEPALPEPAAVAAVDSPDEAPSPEASAAAMQTAETPEEPPAETPVTRSVVTMPAVLPPVLPLAQRQPRSSGARRGIVVPPVAFSRGDAPQEPESKVSMTAASEPVAGSRDAPQGMAHNADQEASLEARIRDAVQAAVRYPAAARMMEVTGRARVQLDYRNGSVDTAWLAQSSGTQALDQAALRAAQGAHYPATPPALAGRLMHFLVWVEFRAG